MTNTRILYLLTRAPLHVGAGSSVGAIDQPIIRERHTQFPIIPATSLKGSFADQWPATKKNAKGQTQRLSTKEIEVDGNKQRVLDEADDAAWLFGSDTTDLSFAGSLRFSEARLIAFPIRSAKGSFAWITCPLMLQRAARDGALSIGSVPAEPKDDEAIFKADGPLALGSAEKQIVLEEYCFKASATAYPSDLAKALAGPLPGDDLFQSITDRLVILSNGMMSHFATTACEVAQHVRISDETGTADAGGLFNQENVPADTLFYFVLGATRSRVPSGSLKDKPAIEALDAFGEKVTTTRVFQFGGDASTGLGFCSVSLSETKGA